MRWLDVVNSQAERLSPLERTLGTVFLRQVLLAEARHALGPHPTETFRGVVGDRVLRNGQSYLEVLPYGLTEDATHVIPSVMIPCDRELHPGSIVDVEMRMEDPDIYDAKDGVFARAAQVSAVLAIER